MTITYNIGSLAFGLLAWGIPIVSLLTRHKSMKWSAWGIFASFAFMGLALVFQLMSQQYLASVNDVTAFLDVIDGVVVVSWILYGGTLVSNLILILGILKPTQVSQN